MLDLKLIIYSGKKGKRINSPLEEVAGDEVLPLSVVPPLAVVLRGVVVPEDDQGEEEALES